MKKEEKSSLIKKYLDAYNSYDIPTMVSLLHNEIKFKNISRNQLIIETIGIQEFEELAKKLQKLFSLRKQTVTDIHWNNENVSVSISFEGLVASDMPNGIKMGEVFKVIGKSEFSFKDNKIFMITDIS